MEKNKWFVGKKIYGPYPSEAAVWAGQNGAFIDGTHFKQSGYFEIRAIPRADKTAEKIGVLREYLNNTDWYVMRFVETGVPVPADIKAKRLAVRAEINALQKEENPAVASLDERNKAV